jgi:hypothetical protein
LKKLYGPPDAQGFDSKFFVFCFSPPIFFQQSPHWVLEKRFTVVAHHARAAARTTMPIKVGNAETGSGKPNCEFAVWE